MLTALGDCLTRKTSRLAVLTTLIACVGCAGAKKAPTYYGEHPNPIMRGASRGVGTAAFWLPGIPISIVLMPVTIPVGGYIGSRSESLGKTSNTGAMGGMYAPASAFAWIGTTATGTALWPLVGWWPGPRETYGKNANQVPPTARIVVLTFDDSVKSHATFVGPLLKEYGFGATFFVTEGFDFTTNKELYMTWEEIRGLHDAGFEIGNHTRAHAGVNSQTREQFLADLEHIEKRCAEHGIPAPKTFAYPGNALSPMAAEALNEKGYLFARRGGAPEFPYEGGKGRAYDPAADHPLLIPSAGDARPDWTLENFKAAAAQAQAGRIAVLQFHGVPDIQHPWVHTDPERFREYMDYLKKNGFKVIALRDLEKYVDLERAPADAREALETLAKTKSFNAENAEDAEKKLK